MQNVISENEGLIYSACSTFRANARVIEEDTGITVEDIYQVASMALLQARDSYEAGKGKFSTYAYRVIQGKVSNYIRDHKIVKLPRSLNEAYISASRKAKIDNMSLLDAAKALGFSDSLVQAIEAHRQRHLFLDSPMGTEDGDSTTYVDLLSEESFEKETDRMIILNEFLSTLTEEEKDVWFSHHREGASQSEVAASRNTYQTYVGRLLKKIEDKAVKFGVSQGLRA